MSHLWKNVQDEMVDDKTFTKKSNNFILVPNQRYLDSSFLQNPKVCRIVMGFSNHAQTFTPLNYSS